MVANQKARVLILDSDAERARSLNSHLARRGLDVAHASTEEEAVGALRVYEPVLVVLGAPSSGAAALDSLQRIKQIRPSVAVVMLSDEHDPAMIFRASKLGADDLLGKPFELKELDIRINRILQKQRLAAEVTQLRDQVWRGSDFALLFGASPKMEEVKKTIEQVADTTATVLIRGESGTGKEVVARMIHGQSSRREKPFVKVNCAAIPHELLESELFGYEPGAFTGANRQKLGKFDLAHGGTIFLDEVSEMHPSLQAKLLHVLQDGEFSRLGGKRDISVDVRILAATNKDLEQAVEEGLFREDLFYRLNVITIHIPPLRERREEILVFLDYFLRKYSEVYGKQPTPFGDYAVGRMMEYRWPGNIRELENLVKRYVIVGNESLIISDISANRPTVSSIGANSAGRSVKDFRSEGSRLLPKPAPPVAIPIDVVKLSDAPSLLDIGRRAAMVAEREAIEHALAQTRWNRRQAAKLLKISYKALLNKLKAMEEQNVGQNRNLTA